jgi:hypothetical protein
MTTIYSLICDAPEPWLFGIQDPASPGAEGLTELHDVIIFYVLVIGIGVTWVIANIMQTFRSKISPISHRYYNHGTVVELIWTITPAVVLIAIAFPSFRLLYLFDSNFFDISTVASIGAMPAKVVKKQPSLSGETKSTAIVPLGEIGSTYKYGRINRTIQTITVFPHKIICILVGHLLGDGHMWKSWSSRNPYFVFTQALAKFSYIFSVYKTLAHFCNTIPAFITTVRKGTDTFRLTVSTRSYPFLNLLEDLFYHIVNGGRKKFISLEILTYIEPLTLAVWAIDDGGKQGPYCFKLCTQGFTFEDVYKLAAILHYRFGLIVQVTTVINNSNKQPLIIIPGKSIDLFVSIVKPYFHPSILYKLHRGKVIK